MCGVFLEVFKHELDFFTFGEFVGDGEEVAGGVGVVLFHEVEAVVVGKADDGAVCPEWEVVDGAEGFHDFDGRVDGFAVGGAFDGVEVRLGLWVGVVKLLTKEDAAFGFGPLFLGHEVLADVGVAAGQVFGAVGVWEDFSGGFHEVFDVAGGFLAVGKVKSDGAGSRVVALCFFEDVGGGLVVALLHEKSAVEVIDVGIWDVGMADFAFRFFAHHVEDFFKGFTKAVVFGEDVVLEEAAFGCGVGLFGEGLERRKGVVVVTGLDEGAGLFQALLQWQNVFGLDGFQGFEALFFRQAFHDHAFASVFDVRSVGMVAVCVGLFAKVGNVCLCIAGQALGDFFKDLFEVH